MAFEFITRSVDSKKDLNVFMDYMFRTMVGEKNGYPNVEDWLMKTEFEIGEEIKKPIGTWYYNLLVANTIYQTHKELPNILEVKNIRSIDLIKHRGISTFQWKQIEFEERQNYDGAIVDTRADNKEMCGFLEHLGFKPIGTKPLYNSGDLDIVYFKEFKKNTNAINISKSLIFGK